MVLLLLLLVYAFHIVNDIRERARATQWDLMVYYYAAKAHGEDLNPCDLRSLEETSGEKFWLTFAYHPATFPFFKLMNYPDCNTVHRTWLILKLVSLAALVILWRKYFIKNISFSSLIILILLAYDAA